RTTPDRNNANAVVLFGFANNFISPNAINTNHTNTSWFGYKTNLQLKLSIIIVTALVVAASSLLLVTSFITTYVLSVIAMRKNDRDRYHIPIASKLVAEAPTA